MSFAALALSALAITAGGAVDPPLGAAGYSQPDITADNCAVKSPGLTVCFLRPRTMGRYMVHVEGVSTANGADATQSISIGASNSWSCGGAETKPGPSWTSGARTFVAQCSITVLSDAPLEIDATFGGQNATLDPAGPAVTIRRMPWNGVLTADPLGAMIKSPEAK